MHWTVLLILSLITFIYMLVGGALFMVLERKTEENFQIQTLHFLQEFYENNTACMSAEELGRVLVVTLKAYQHGFNIKMKNGTFSHIINKWDYMGSIYFASTVVSTIGYGHITPKTYGGKVFCIFYGILGIPLFLVVLAATGNKITLLTGRIAAKLEFCRRRPMAGKALTTALLVVVGSIVFITLPAAGFSHFEEWSYTDSIYFAFVTLLTIGFGDYIPTSTVQDSKDFYLLWATLWFFLGLAWLSTIISSIQDAIGMLVEKADSNKIHNACEGKEKVQADEIASISSSTQSLHGKLVKC